MSTLFTIKPADLRDPGDSKATTLKVECALDCDGSICNRLYCDESGEVVEADPHFHLVEAGIEPEASARYYYISSV
jgi:hypothetical protein